MELDQDINTGKIEIWGGAEYSYVRVGNNVYDQLACSGHEERPDDLRHFHDLGIRTIRYPLLWEKYSENEDEFFRINDLRLEYLRDHGISPIAGLLHHGSGPFFTDLHDREFPTLLAGFAQKIAFRYPWIEYYTPVNEPLTTARFSGLYGIWYPHLRDNRAFARIFLNELRGVVLSMKAIREVNPDAKLIQTEDLCRIYSTGELSYQAGFENLRRWLTYDFLTGSVDRNHPMRKYFLENGIMESELDFFMENPVSPYICGFNYYVTSERYLDHHKSVYPSCFHGGNGIQEYADVEAVRANIPAKTGSLGLLREAWERYRLPLALTEVHLACTREEQLRWFYESWQTANTLKSEGVDFRAVTAWSFFGSFDWSSLLCEKRNDYESGIFDIRSGVPRATALARLVATLNKGETPRSDLLNVPGWWRRNDRMIYKAENEHFNIAPEKSYGNDHVRPLLIVGATGSLGNALARICASRGIVFHLSGRDEMDIASEESVINLIHKINPWAVVNAAGFTRIDDAESAAYTCFRENTIGPVILAEACRREGIAFVTFSADQVFNGKKNKPYEEDDCTNPLNLYGLSKKLAEEKVLRVNPGSLIIRSSFFFNPWHTNDGLSRLITSAMTSDRQISLPSDIVISPAFIPALVNIVLDLLIDEESGIWHISGQEEISLYDFARKALGMAGIDSDIVVPVPSSKLKYAAKRPAYSVLKSSSGIILPRLESALVNYIDEFRREAGIDVMNQISTYTEVQ